MRQSQLFGKTLREAPKDEISSNAILLSRAGYIEKLMAGVYSYLPLGFKVLQKIQQIVREEMTAIGGQEVYLPALQPKELWQETNRWEKLAEIMFQFKGRGDKDIGLATTHEEVIVDIVRKRLTSYRDLPIYLFQIQDKFRNEPRAKAGLLRGREFSMKDLYSFHRDRAELDQFYQQAIQAYQNVFRHCGLTSIITEASGGVFTKDYSHEFQVLTPTGEDEIVFCSNGDFAQNREICDLADGDKCPNCQQPVKVAKSIEVGNIFKLGDTYSKSMGLTYVAESGKKQEVIMGCYGIGPSRVMGAVVEIYHDQKGIIWPGCLSPFQVHLIAISEQRKKTADKIYQQLSREGIEALYDERAESAGVKLNDADLIGINLQLIVGDKNKEKVEYRLRNGQDGGLVNEAETIKLVKKMINQ